MTNPLLQPDGRFRPKTIDPAHSNPFAEPSSPTSEGQLSDAGLLAPPQALASESFASQTYQPRYEMSYPHRGGMVTWLGGIGLLLSGSLLLLYSERPLLILLGFAGQFLGISLSLVATILAYGELSGMTAGAIDDRGRSSALAGFRIGLAGLILGFGALAGVILLIVRGILDVDF